jgi:hypothetical protein
MKPTILISCLLVISFCLTVLAQTASRPSVTIKPGGCDLTECGTCNGTSTCPVATIAEGVALLSSGGGIVSLLAGTYTGQGNADVTLTNGDYSIRYTPTLSPFRATLTPTHSSSTLNVHSAQAFGIVYLDCAGLPGFTVNGGSAYFYGLIITNCRRTDGNGGAFSVHYASVTLSKMDAQYNSAQRGGVLYVENGSASVSQMSMENNSAAIGGAGVFAYRAQITTELVAVEDSTAGSDVGCEQGTITFKAPTIIDTIACTYCSCPTGSVTP